MTELGVARQGAHDGAWGVSVTHALMKHTPPSIHILEKATHGICA